MLGSYFDDDGIFSEEHVNQLEADTEISFIRFYSKSLLKKCIARTSAESFGTNDPIRPGLNALMASLQRYNLLQMIQVKQ